MRAEYDFSRGVRGKYSRRYAQGTNVVVLQPDVARAVIVTLQKFFGKLSFSNERIGWAKEWIS